MRNENKYIDIIFYRGLSAKAKGHGHEVKLAIDVLESIYCSIAAESLTEQIKTAKMEYVHSLITNLKQEEKK